MKGMDKISAAVLNKVRKEAQDLVKEAEKEGEKVVEEAKEQRAERLREDSDKMVAQAEAEATRIMAQASVVASQELLSAKAGVIDEIINRAKKKLSTTSTDESLTNLIKEAIEAIELDEVKVCVSSRDVDRVKKIIKRDKEMNSKVKAVAKADLSGGVIVESLDGEVEIDNTYDTRLEMLLPKIIPDLNKELFKDI